jgi:hypothetical protein
MKITTQWKIFYVVSVLVAVALGVALMILFGPGSSPPPNAQTIVSVPTRTRVPTGYRSPTPTCGAWTAKKNTCVVTPTPEPDYSAGNRRNDILCGAQRSLINPRITRSPTRDEFCKNYHATRTAEASNPTNIARAETRTAVASKCAAPFSIVVPERTPSPVSAECVSFRATEQAFLRYNRVPVMPTQKLPYCRSGPWWLRLLCAGAVYSNNK